MANDVPIAERKLKHEDGREVCVQVYAPVHVGAGHWECRVHVEGLDVADTVGYGVDGFQALTEAFVAARAALSVEETRLTWLSNVPGDTGMPVVLPYEDPRLAALVEGLANVERQRFYLYASPLKARGDEEE